MCLSELQITSNIRDYRAFFEKDDAFLHSLACLENAVFIVDENVFALHKDGILQVIPENKIILLEIHESKKTLDSVCALYEKIMAFAPRKNLNLISIGGGITQDVTGFVASSLYRGVNWIFIPTTLLAQVDSCIGAKTSLNFKQYKNLIGTFYPPSRIHIYPEFLKTLSRNDYYSGIGEMAKLHIMNGEADTKTFIEAIPNLDQRDVSTVLARTQKCLAIKKEYIENDEFDTGKRNMLNYGHCFGHAIESATDFAISHGQAIVVGMMLANKEAVKKGLLSPELEEFVKSKVLDPILVCSMPQCKASEIVKAMQQDKKNTGAGLALVMLGDNYEMIKRTDLQTQEVMESLGQWLQ